MAARQRRAHERVTLCRRQKAVDGQQRGVNVEDAEAGVLEVDRQEEAGQVRVERGAGLGGLPGGFQAACGGGVKVATGAGEVASRRGRWSGRVEGARASLQKGRSGCEQHYNS